jgi:hypothetical protein
VEWNSRNRSGREFMFEYEVGIEEIMSTAGVDQCWKWWANEGIGCKRNCERVRSGKSRHVESNLVCRTNGVNTALSSCRGWRTADYFLSLLRESLRTFLLSVCCVSFGFGGGRSGLRTLVGHVTSFTAKEAKVVVKPALLFCLGELPVFSEFVGKVGSCFPVVLIGV